jgi:hypothetical protein
MAAAPGVAAFFVAVALQAPVFKGNPVHPGMRTLPFRVCRLNTRFCWLRVIRGRKSREPKCLPADGDILRE